MSLLGHLVRATLAPEQALRPALPQQFANWGVAADGDDLEWSDVPSAVDPVVPIAHSVPEADAPATAHARPVPSEAAQGASRSEPVLPPPRAAPSLAVPAPQREYSTRNDEPQVDNARTAPAAPPRSTALQPEPSVKAAAPRRRAAPSASIEDQAPEPARAVTPPAHVLRIAEPVPSVGLVADLPRVVASTVVDAPAEALARPPAHEAAAPVHAEAGPSEPRRYPPRLSEPRFVSPTSRAASSEVAPSPGAERPLVVPVTPPALVAAPVATIPPAVAPILAAPQVMLPEPASERPQLPDVHISIGRVEVRAAAAPSRPAPREANGKNAPLSLEAYLTRRNAAAR